MASIEGLTSLEKLSLEGSPIKAGLPQSLSALRCLRELRASFCFTKAMAKRKGKALPCIDALGALSENSSRTPTEAGTGAVAEEKKEGSGGERKIASELELSKLEVLELRSVHMSKYSFFSRVVKTYRGFFTCHF